MSIGDNEPYEEMLLKIAASCAIQATVKIEKAVGELGVELRERVCVLVEGAILSTLGGHDEGATSRLIEKFYDLQKTVSEECRSRAWKVAEKHVE